MKLLLYSLVMKGKENTYVCLGVLSKHVEELADWSEKHLLLGVAQEVHS